MGDLARSREQAAGDALRASTGERAQRDLALKRLQRKRKVVGDAVAYVVINTFLVVVWALGDGGYFWPGWVMGGWGMLLLLDVWNAYFRRPITDADIERELRSSRSAM